MAMNQYQLPPGGAAPMEGAPMGEEQPQEQQGGYCIQICVMPTGEITVGKTMEMPAEPGQPANDIKDALGQALAMYKANPGNTDEQAQFSAGFGGATGQPQGPASKY